MRALLVIALCACGKSSAPPMPSPNVLAISLVYEGASAPVIERAVVMPVEQAVASVSGVQAIVSRVEADHATVSVELAPRTDVDRAAHDLQHALALVQPQLPSDVAPPMVTRTRRDDTPVIVYAARSESLPIAEVSARIHDVIVPDVQRAAGVARIVEHGVAKQALIVRPDLAKLYAAGATIFDVLAALQAANIQVPAGRVEEGGAQLRVTGEITNPEMLGELAIRGPAKLRDVATVEYGFEREPGSAGPSIAIHAHPQADRAVVAKTVRERVAALGRLQEDVQLVETPPAKERPPASLVVSLRGPELDRLEALADSLQLGADVERDPPKAQPERTYSTDRQEAADLGIPLPDIIATLRALGGAQAGFVEEHGARREIIVRVPDAIDQLYVRTQQGVLVPITNVVTATLGTTTTIVRRDGERSITFSIYKDTDRARSAVKKLELPVGYRVVVTP